MFRSIKLKFIVWFILVFSTLFTGLGFFIYYKLEGIVLDSVDRHLNSEVQLLANLLSVEDGYGQLKTEFLEFSSAATGEYAVSLSGRYYQVITEDGRILIRSPSLFLADKTLPIQPVSFEPLYGTIMGPEDEPLRILSQSFEYSIGILTIQAADSLKDAYELLRSFRNIILIVFPSVFVLSLAGISILTSRVLSPIDDFSEKISRITEKNLNERIDDAGIDRELRSLAVSFNTMLQRLEEHFTRQRQFFSNASHELRTPTSVIKSYCDVSLKRERTPAEYREALQKISEITDRISSIINRILEVSRLDGKTSRLSITGFNMRDVLDDVIRLLSPTASNRGIGIEFNGDDVYIRGDREMLAEAFTNIVDNAIKYNRSGGTVGIEISRKDGMVAVAVRDTGIGIPENEKERLFDRFYRVDTSRGMVHGSGLGLSIAKIIIDAHGGRIDVESTVGRGSCFTVYLPEG